MILVRMAQSGQLRGRVSEEQLIELLNQASNLVEIRPHKFDPHHLLDGGSGWKVSSEENDYRGSSNLLTIALSLPYIASITGEKAWMTTSTFSLDNYEQWSFYNSYQIKGGLVYLSTCTMEKGK
jgi:hypothetical protein